MAKSKRTTRIQNVSVDISYNQNNYEKKKNFFENKYILIIGFIGTVLGILSYFGFQPSEKPITKPTLTSAKSDTLLNKIEDKIIMKQPIKVSAENRKTNPMQPISVNNVNGDVVISQNQTGGITAHTVYFKQPKRNLENSVKTILEFMKKVPPSAYRLEYSNSDMETYNLAQQIDEILIKLGWETIPPILHIAGPPYEPGITLYSLTKSEPIMSLSSILYKELGGRGVNVLIVKELNNIFQVNGWPAQEISSGKSGIVIEIGPNPEE